MSGDELDEMMGRLAPPPEVTSDRVARVMGNVMARLDETRPATGSVSRFASWLAGLVPVSRFALPMAAAALLGIVVGQEVRPAGEAVALDQALVSTYYAGLGY